MDPVLIPIMAIAIGFLIAFAVVRLAVIFAKRDSRINMHLFKHRVNVSFMRELLMRGVERDEAFNRTCRTIQRESVSRKYIGISIQLLEDEMRGVEVDPTHVAKVIAHYDKALKDEEQTGKA